MPTWLTVQNLAELVAGEIYRVQTIEPLQWREGQLARMYPSEVGLVLVLWVEGKLVYISDRDITLVEIFVRPVEA